MDGCEEGGGGSHGRHFEWLGTEDFSSLVLLYGKIVGSEFVSGRMGMCVELEDTR